MTKILFTYKLEDEGTNERVLLLEKQGFKVLRGAVINEQDLIAHLEEGHLKGVALDVFEQEPLPQESKLWEMDRVVITSHNSWISEKIDQRRWELIYNNLLRFKNNQELLNVVEIARGY